MSGKKGLGRGFDSLFPTDLVDDEFDPTSPFDEKVSELTELSLDKIVRDENQPRQDFDEEAIKALAGSIKEHGVLQPIVVTKEDGKYKIVAGERRFRAAKIAGLDKIPAIIRTIDSQNRLELAIIENAQREDLNAIELATAYAKLKTQFNMSLDEMAKKIGKSETSIQNTMRLLNLSDETKKVMVKEKLSEGVMRPLVNAPEELIKKVLPKIVSEGWTARKVEKYVAENKPKSSTAAIKKSLYGKDENRLSDKYNAEVKIVNKTISFKCKTEEELKKLLAKF